VSTQGSELERISRVASYLNYRVDLLLTLGTE
jgi:hypothetical protein